MHNKFYFSSFFSFILSIAYLLIFFVFAIRYPSSFISATVRTAGTLQVITGGQADAALSSAVFWIVAAFTPLLLLCISYVNGNHSPWRGMSRAKRWGIPGFFALAFLLSAVWLLWGSAPRPLPSTFFPTGILALFALVQSFLLSRHCR